MNGSLQKSARSAVKVFAAPLFPRTCACATTRQAAPPQTHATAACTSVLCDERSAASSVARSECQSPLISNVSVGETRKKRGCAVLNSKERGRGHRAPGGREGAGNARVVPRGPRPAAGPGCSVIAGPSAHLLLLRVLTCAASRGSEEFCERKRRLEGLPFRPRPRACCLRH